MKVIIAGGRDFDNYEYLKEICDKILINQNEIEIVSGCANGADKLGEKYANEKRYIIKQFPADWNKYGKSAGYIRNEEMAKYSDALIAFWNKKSKGTMNMINIANKYQLKVKVYYY
jgi:ABC-type enterochelin transport system substrate-binding protein